MKVCSKCGYSNHDAAKICNKCNHRLDTDTSTVGPKKPVSADGDRFCTQCGYRNPKVAKICNKCNHRLEEVAVTVDVENKTSLTETFDDENKTSQVVSNPVQKNFIIVGKNRTAVLLEVISYIVLAAGLLLSIKLSSDLYKYTGEGGMITFMTTSFYTLIVFALLKGFAEIIHLLHKLNFKN